MRKHSKSIIKIISKISIILSNIFQLYILFTIENIASNGFNEKNIVMLIFNIAYIISFQTYNNKIDKLFNQRGEFFSKKREKMTKEEIDKDNEKICNNIFLDIFDEDFRE